MKKRRSRRFAVSSAAGPLVDQVLAKYGVKRNVTEHEVLLGWDRLVGARVAKRAWPIGIKDGVLYVTVSNSSWMHQLGFMKEELLRQIKRQTGDDRVRAIHFEIAGRERFGRAAVDAKVRRPPPIVRRRALPPPATGARLEVIKRESACVEDDELREVIAEARRKLDL